jgi:ribosome-binding factor A
VSELRLRRVESFLESEISSLISNASLKDPRIDSLLTVAGVRAAKDLASARIYISFYGNKTVLKDAVAALNGAAGFIQHEIAQHLRMRNTPKLRFLVDESVQKGFEITQQLKDLAD